MNKINILFIDGINDYSTIKKINGVNHINYNLLLFASSFNSDKSIIHYFDYRDVKEVYKKSLLETLEEHDIKYVFITLNCQNHLSIKRLLKSFTKQENIYIIAPFRVVDDELEKFNIITYNNEINLFDQIKIKELEEVIIDSKNVAAKFDLITIKNKTATITTGFIDKKEPTQYLFRESKWIDNEIESILKTGVKYIHINNNSLFKNRNHLNMVKDVFNKKIELYNFSWSAMMDLSAINYTQEFNYNELNNSGLSRLDVLLYHVDSNILNYYNKEISTKDALKFIENICNSVITSVSIKIYIGSENKSEESKKRMLDFMKLAHAFGKGKIEFDINYYTNQKDCLSNSINSQIEPSFKKSTENYYAISRLKEELERFDLAQISKSMKLMSAQERISHLKLLEKGIITKYSYYFLFKSSTYDLFSLNKQNRFHKHSWEIRNSILDYTPIIVGRYIVAENDKSFFRFDSTISTEDDIELTLDSDMFFLIDISKDYKTLGEIFNYCKTNKNISEEKIMFFYNKLEEKDLLFYSKIYR